MKILKELENKTGLEATAVVTRDGLRLACSVSAQIDADIFSAAAAAMVNLGSITIKKLNQGELKEVIVKGDKGYTLVTEVDSNTMLVASGRESFRLGYYLGVLKKYAREVAEIIKKKQVFSPAKEEKLEMPPEEEVKVEEVSLSEEAAEKEEEAQVGSEQDTLERERKAILEALKALGWEEPEE